MPTAVQLIAHGSRRAAANADLVEIARHIEAGGRYPIVVSSYLELAEPSIPDGARQCVAAGADRILMMPYFLSAGSHVTDDLDRFRRALADEFPSVEFCLCPPLGLHPKMLEIVYDRLLEGASEHLAK
jgi:sirohydrochlorin ferrochelatase